MKINYDHFGNIQTYARISRIEIDNDFIKIAKDEKGEEVRTCGRILVDIKLYPSKEACDKYGGSCGLLLSKFENIPIEGVNFNFCKDEISALENVLCKIIESKFKEVNL